MEPKKQSRVSLKGADDLKTDSGEHAINAIARFALDSLAAHIAVLNEHGIVIAVNASWNRFADKNHFPGSRGLGDNYLKVCDTASGTFAEQAKSVATGIRAIIAGQQHEFSLEYSCHSPKLKDWYIVRLTRFVSDGKVRVVVAHENITKQKQIEARFRRLADSNVQGVAFWSTNGKVTGANDAFLKIVRFNREDLEGGRINLMKMTPPEYSHLTRETFEEIAAKGNYATLKKELVCKDGTRVPVLVGVAAFQDNPNEGVSFVIDLTEHKQFERSLTLFRTFIDQSNDGFEVVDPKTGRFLAVNETSCQQSGYTREELLSMHVPEIETVAVDFSSWPKLVKEIRRAGHKIHQGRHRRKDGSSFPIEISVRYVKLDRDYLIAVVRDITERKEAEEALTRSHAQLRALSARLLRVREEESERIAREIHDQLGHALSALSMDLTWIRQKLGAEKSLRYRSQFERRIQATTALLETTVQSVQRICAELRPAILSDLGLTATLEWQAEEFEARTGIRCHWKPRAVKTRANRDQASAVFRIFKEILTNVARHARARSIDLMLVQRRGQLLLEVGDHGKGFNEKKLLPHKSLGLLGMRERATLVGGRVEVWSAPGKGTKITVTVPIPKSEQPRKL